MPDLLVVVGDRYELCLFVPSAVMLRIPIAHISGGEVTSGAVDDVIRNCITKMSYLHFPACEEYARGVIQMGENQKESLTLEILELIQFFIWISYRKKNYKMNCV